MTFVSSIPAEAATITIAKRLAAVQCTVAAWFAKVVLAVLDQGLISGSNFVMGILLARWLSREQYGAYALAFAIFLLVSQFYSSLLLEPLAVFGGSIYRQRLRGYLGSLLWIHLGTALVAFLILGIAAILARAWGLGGNLPSALAAVTVAAPCVLLFWLVRRAFYLEPSPAAAVLGALFYSLFVLGGLFVINRYGLLSAFTAFLLMAFGALMTSALSLLRLKPNWRLKSLSPSLRESWGQHWGYGRWALATSVLLWFPSNLFFPLLSALFGMASAGDLKALVNLSLPIANTASALSLLFQPHASRINHQQGAARLRSFSWSILVLYGGGGVAYWSLLVMFPAQVMRFLYGGNYANLVPLVPWLALGSVLQLAMAGPTIGLRAMESPASVFVANCTSCAVSFLLGIPLAWKFGVRGVVMAMMASSLVGLVTSYILLTRKGERVAEATA
jgi:O-antigen/teichoic acid export membrane protein